MGYLTNTLIGLSGLSCIGDVVAVGHWRSHPQRHHRRAAPAALHRRNGNPTVATATSTMDILTIITPSPSATPVTITEQGQIVTMYEPQVTICSIYTNGSTSLEKLPIAPSMSTQLSSSIDSNCTTIYNSYTTSICHATLTGLASKVIVSECAQQVTFSKDYGAAIVTPSPKLEGPRMITPAPSIQMISTYYAAPWTDLTSGRTPSKVRVAACSASGINESATTCTEWDEVWSASTMFRVMETTTAINFSSVVTGPVNIMYGTQMLNVSGTTTLQLSTYLTTSSNLSVVTTVRSTVSTPKVTKEYTSATPTSEEARSTKTITDEVTVTRRVRLATVNQASSTTFESSPMTTSSTVGLEGSRTVNIFKRPTSVSTMGTITQSKDTATSASKSQGSPDSIYMATQTESSSFRTMVVSSHNWNTTRLVS